MQQWIKLENSVITCIKCVLKRVVHTWPGMQDGTRPTIHDKALWYLRQMNQWLTNYKQKMVHFGILNQYYLVIVCRYLCYLCYLWSKKQHCVCGVISTEAPPEDIKQIFQFYSQNWSSEKKNSVNLVPKEYKQSLHCNWEHTLRFDL